MPPATAAPGSSPEPSPHLPGLPKVEAAVESAVEAAAEAAAGAAQAATEAASTVTDAATAAADVAVDHAVVRHGVRMGLAVDGVLHILLGWAALKLAIVGFGDATTDESGVLTSLASTVTGMVLLVAGVLGFGIVAVWFFAKAVSGHRCPSRMVRLANVAEGCGYAALAWSAGMWAFGQGVSDRSQWSRLTQSLMAQPAGRWLVVLAGLVVIAVGGFHIWSGWSRDFLDELARDPGPVAVALGRVGFVAKGLAFVGIGAMFGVAAYYRRAAESTGTDGAARALYDEPFGRTVIGVVAVGLMAFGVHLMVRARHTDF